MTTETAVTPTTTPTLDESVKAAIHTAVESAMAPVLARVSELDAKLAARATRKAAPAFDESAFPVGKTVSVNVGRGSFNGTVKSVDPATGKVTVTVPELNKDIVRPHSKVGAELPAKEAKVNVEAIIAKLAN
jgi:transcription antitermination factor NusG